MKCTHADVWIQQAVDGRLSPAKRARLDAHLGHCEACRGAWAEYRRLGQTASAWARPQLPAQASEDAFTAQVMARIADGPVPEAPRRSWAILALAVSALAALSFWAGPFLPHSLPAVSLTGLPSPHAVFSPEALRQAFSRVPQDALGAWDMLVTASLGLPRWAGSALAVTLGVNLFFAWRARHQPRGAAAR